MLLVVVRATATPQRSEAILTNQSSRNEFLVGFPSSWSNNPLWSPHSPGHQGKTNVSDVSILGASNPYASLASFPVCCTLDWESVENEKTGFREEQLFFF